MDKEILKAYEYLVPADQLIIDAMIVSLYKKDKQIKETVEEIKNYLNNKENKNAR